MSEFNTHRVKVDPQLNVLNCDIVPRFRELLRVPGAAALPAAV